MRTIKFMSFIEGSGDDVLGSWYSKQKRKDQAKFDDGIDALTDYANWRLPLIRRLTEGDCKDLIEIRFKIKNVQQRPIRSFGIVKDTFVILLWATEKGGEFVPKDACSQAQGRKAVVERDPKKAKDYGV